MKKLASTTVLIIIVALGIAAPAAAYAQRTTYPEGGVNFKDGICSGYGGSETDFVQTVQLSASNTCDYIQVRANYRNGSWVGYSNWVRGTGYKQFVAPGNSVINFGQHGLDSWR
jgi:hypothetical protein